MWHGPDLLQVLVVPALLATSVGNIFPVEMDLDDIDIPGCKEIYPDEEKPVFASSHADVIYDSIEARLSRSDVCFIGIVQDVSFRCCENRFGIRQGMGLVRFEALTTFWGGEGDNYDILLWMVNIPGCVNYIGRASQKLAQSDFEIGNKYVVSAQKRIRSGMLEAITGGLVKCENIGTQGGVVAEDCPPRVLEVSASLAKSFSFKRVKSESDVLVIGRVTENVLTPPDGSMAYFRVHVEQILKGKPAENIKIVMYDRDDVKTYFPYYDVTPECRYLFGLRRFKGTFLPTRGRWSVFEIVGNRVRTCSGYELGSLSEFVGED